MVVWIADINKLQNWVIYTSRLQYTLHQHINSVRLLSSNCRQSASNWAIDSMITNNISFFISLIMVSAIDGIALLDTNLGWWQMVYQYIVYLIASKTIWFSSAPYLLYEWIVWIHDKPSYYYRFKYNYLTERNGDNDIILCL